MSEQINCFNGSQCLYNAGCPFFKEDKCVLERMKSVSVSSTPPPRRPQQEALPTAPYVSEGVRSINSLTAGEKGSKQTPLCLKGTLVFDPIQKDVDTQYGPSTVTSIILKDATGEAKISFWGDAGNQIMNFVLGDTLLLGGLYRVQEPYDGKAQVDGGKYYKVAKTN